MATSAINEVLQHVRSSLRLPDGAGATDGELMDAFVNGREPAALEVLVRRYAPMVWGVCRRLLVNHQDAEDAFQATFLVLVRKGASIRSRCKVGNWLYGVAYQTARKARATAAKRRAREQQVTHMPEPAATPDDRDTDLQPLLDQELSRLPEKYRTVLVLCELGGTALKDAARQLGCAEGTVGSRLTRARTMLAKRLAGRGLAVTGSTIAALLAQQTVSASVPTAVLSSTIKATALVAAGQTTAAAIAPTVAALTEGVLKAMLLGKLKTALGVLVIALSMAGLGTGLFVYPSAVAQPGESGKPRALAGDSQQQPAKGRPAQDDLARLQGKWECTSEIRKGKQGRANLPRITIKDQRIISEDFNEEGFQIDPAKTPKYFDIIAIASGKPTTVARGIYEIKGNHLRICFDASGKGRPTAFESAEGSSNHLLAFKRMQQETANPDDLKPAAKKDKVPLGIQPGDRLQIDVHDTIPNRPIKSPLRVEPEGTVNLGAPYGRVQVKGKTIVQAEAAIRAKLETILKVPQVSVSRYDPPVEERYQMLERQVQDLRDELRALRGTVEQLRKQKSRENPN